MPRKYHRPPTTSTTKRRKPRKSTIPYEFGQPDESAVDVDVTFDGEEDDGQSSGALASDLMSGVSASSGLAGKAERHVTVDYSYVRGEVIRIVAIVSFLVIALIITSFFR